MTIQPNQLGASLGHYFQSGTLRAQVLDLFKINPAADAYNDLGVTDGGWTENIVPQAEPVSGDWLGPGTILDWVHLGSARTLSGTLIEANRPTVQALLHYQAREVFNATDYSYGNTNLGWVSQGRDAQIGCLWSLNSFKLRFIPIASCQAQTQVIVPFCALSPTFVQTYPRVAGLTRIPIELVMFPYIADPDNEESVWDGSGTVPPYNRPTYYSIKAYP